MSHRAEAPRALDRRLAMRPAVEEAREVTVVGAGPVGVLLALLLADRGYRVTVFEARRDPRNDPSPGGRSINLTLAERGWRALREAGVEAEIREISLPLIGRMIHAEDGRLRFQRYTPAGDAIYSASRAGVTRRLLDLTDGHPRIALHFGHRCHGVDVARRVLHIGTPTGAVVEVRPDRLLASDGAFSAVRRSLLRDPDFRFYQRLSPIAYRELKLPPTDTGDFAFARDALHLWPRGDGMIAGFPNVDRSFTISMFMPAHGEVSFAALSDRGVLDGFLRESCADLAPRLQDLAHDFFNGTPAPLLSSGCAPWAHGDWLCMIGDAAHTLVPFLGQGLNAGFEDTSVLMRCLEATGQEWGPALAAFEAERHSDCEAAITLAEQDFDELARAARDPGFMRRKAIEERLHTAAPDRFVPLYTMVAFHCHPYAEIARIRERHEALIDRLEAVPDIERRWDAPDVRELVAEELAAFTAGWRAFATVGAR